MLATAAITGIAITTQLHALHCVSKHRNQVHTSLKNNFSITSET